MRRIMSSTVVRAVLFKYVAFHEPLVGRGECTDLYPSGPLTRGGGRGDGRTSSSSIQALPLRPCRSSPRDHFHTTEPFTGSFPVSEKGSMRTPICPQLTRFSHGAAWEQGELAVEERGRWTVGSSKEKG
ncbi:hypothetical protein VZT92_014489 [Zoarces viviparus]|uniref:Uncharacterized protein n=1 Tax=Zoarces viviparus TaxID=48416 RepID=A0AAW1F019_ZOAVI